jgi:uncharacterized protein YndB with AHSA1/START domain
LTPENEATVTGGGSVNAANDVSGGVTVVDDGPMLRAVVRGLDCSLDTALAAFTDADVLARWWGRAELSADLVAGGRYTVRFEAIDRTMTGQVVDYEPGRYLEFSWAWAHSPDDPPRTVMVTVDGEPAGAVLTVVHGPHGDGEDEEAARQGNREGWEFFLPRLARVLSGD